VHLRPGAEVAERVLLPGDPGRALRLAQQLVDTPKMLNHHRGLWGYTGPAADGRPLTIQSTGIGGPSTAVVAEELIRLGARRLVRVGTCTGTPLGGLVLVEAALAEDGASRALGFSGPVSADPDLLAALRAAAPGAPAVTIVSADLYYDPEPDRWAAESAVDLSTAALFAVAARHGVAAASVLLVSRAGGRVLDPEALEEAERELGRVGYEAVRRDQRTSTAH
jgi:uridine phosphorylase